jgi:hypothetical protein
VQKDLDALRAAADQFTRATIHGYAYNPPFSKHGNVSFVAGAFRNVLTTPDGLLRQWQKELNA